MENINVIINKHSRMIQNISKRVIGNDGENLQENLVFSFDDEFVNGTARLEITMPDGTNCYHMLTKVDETYQLPVKSIMTKEGKIYMQLVVTEGTDEESIPIFKSNVFFVAVNYSINAEIEQPEGYTQWIDIANAKLNQIDTALDEVNVAINEVNTLDIDVSKEGKIVTIDLTKKDGSKKSESVRDGYDLDYDWDGTSLGVKREDEEEYEYVDLKGEKGDCYFATFEIVNGHLKMNKPDELSQLDFSLNSRGHLELEVSI